MNADTAYEEWLNSPEQEFKANHDRASFLAGYRRALQDAADNIRAFRNGEFDMPAGMTHYPYSAGFESWLRDRAAAVGVTGDTGEEPK
jgi:hypothetical protein